MTEVNHLDRLHAILGKVLSDDEIIAHPRIMPRGLKKIAQHLGVEEGQVPDLIYALGQQLSRETVAEDIDTPVRYSWESDNAHNITIRDSKTAKEKFLGVQQAEKLMQKLEGNAGTEQDILAQAMMESVGHVQEDDAHELSADEMDTGSSTYNFPWKMGGDNGFGTASYSGFGRNFKIKIISLTDRDGNPIDFGPQQMKTIESIALGYVDEA